MTDVDSPPSCFGFHPHAIQPANCIECPSDELCKRVVAKERLEELLEKLVQVEEAGERIEQFL